MRQVIANLFSNALHHTPPGTPIDVSVRFGSSEAHLTVADQGPGMIPWQAERVFERFYRADPARSPASGGSGLGLSIVAALVSAHGGRAEVDTARAWVHVPHLAAPGRKRTRGLGDRHQLRLCCLRLVRGTGMKEPG